MLHAMGAAPTGAGGPYDPLPPLPPPCHKDIPLSEWQQQQEENAATTCPSTTTAESHASFPALSFAPGVGVMSLRRPLAYRDKATAVGFLLHLLGLCGGLWTAALASFASSSSPLSGFLRLLPRLFFAVLAGAALAYFVVLSPLLLHRRSVFVSRYVHHPS